MTAQLLPGDALDVLATLPGGGVQACITSPPYFGLRDYGEDGQIGLEATPDEYVARLVAVFREVRRVLADDGTLWLNLGDSFKDKQLQGIPWRVAFALQDDGWILRQDIIWHKPGVMPENVRDRCTKAHEYVFLLSKAPRYYYDADAIAEPAIHAGDVKTNAGGKNADMGQYGQTRTGFLKPEGVTVKDTRNKRSVWTVTTKPYPEAHFATYPPDLIRPCVLAGTRPGDTVLDPFNGSGTTGQVALEHGRDYIGIDVNADYLELARRRLAPLLAQPRLLEAVGA